MTWRPVTPASYVDVRYRGRWLRGFLSVWRRDPGSPRWVGYVKFTHPDGVTQPAWIDQDDVKRRPG